MYPCISGIIVSNISDHMPNFIIMLNQDLGRSDKCRIAFRDHSDANMGNFLTRIEQGINFTTIAENDIDLLVESFQDLVNKIYCRSFPLKIKFLSRKRLSNPWLSDDLLARIKLKAKYFKLLKLELISN